MSYCYIGLAVATIYATHPHIYAGPKFINSSKKLSKILQNLALFIYQVSHVKANTK